MAWIEEKSRIEVFISMSLDVEQIENYHKLLEKFVPLAKNNDVQKTFLELLERNTREVTYSKMLAFLLHSDNSHYFGDLFVRSLIQAYLQSLNSIDHSFIKSKSDTIDKLSRLLESKIETTDYLTEEKTSNENNGKFIDIIIESDYFVICIENKIYASLDNDLEEYSLYLEKGKYLNKDLKIKIVLSLFRINDEKNNNKMINSNFINVTYKSFLEIIELNIGSYLNEKNQYFWQVVHDFKKTIFNLYERNKPMDRQTIDFFMQHWGEIAELNKYKNNFVKHIERSLDLIKSLIVIPEPWINHIKKFDIHKPESCVYIDIPIQTSSICIVVDLFLEIHNQGVRISFSREENNYPDLVKIIMNSLVQSVFFAEYSPRIDQIKNKDLRQAIFIDLNNFTQQYYLTDNNYYAKLFTDIINHLTNEQIQSLLWQNLKIDN
jgi:hypothetical protein